MLKKIKSFTEYKYNFIISHYWVLNLIVKNILKSS